MQFTNILALAATFAACVGAQSSTVSAPSASASATPFTGELGNATVVTNNPPGIIYTAVSELMTLSFLHTEC
jgi:ABC-type Fe3+-hydroxamate transport system substrate-binding protein